MGRIWLTDALTIALSLENSSYRAYLEGHAITEHTHSAVL